MKMKMIINNLWTATVVIFAVATSHATAKNKNSMEVPKVFAHGELLKITRTKVPTGLCEDPGFESYNMVVEIEDELATNIDDITILEPVSMYTLDLQVVAKDRYQILASGHIVFQNIPGDGHQPQIFFVHNRELNKTTPQDAIAEDLGDQVVVTQEVLPCQDRESTMIDSDRNGGSLLKVTTATTRPIVTSQHSRRPPKYPRHTNRPITLPENPDYDRRLSPWYYLLESKPLNANEPATILAPTNNTPPNRPTSNSSSSNFNSSGSSHSSSGSSSSSSSSGAHASGCSCSSTTAGTGPRKATGNKGGRKLKSTSAE